MPTNTTVSETPSKQRPPTRHSAKDNSARQRLAGYHGDTQLMALPVYVKIPENPSWGKQKIGHWPIKENAQFTPFSQNKHLFMTRDRPTADIIQTTRLIFIGVFSLKKYQAGVWSALHTTVTLILYQQGFMIVQFWGFSSPSEGTN